MKRVSHQRPQLRDWIRHWWNVGLRKRRALDIDGVTAIEVRADCRRDQSLNRLKPLKLQRFEMAAVIGAVEDRGDRDPFDANGRGFGVGLAQRGLIVDD